MKNYTGKEGQTNPAPQQHIIDDEDDYVEVTGVDDDVEDGWEEVMVVNSPPTRKADNAIQNTPSTSTTITTAPVNVLPQPTQPITINNTVNLNNNNVATQKIPEVFVERVSTAPKAPQQDPTWLASLKANGKTPYSAPTLGDPQYVAPLVGEPYAQSSIGLPYASPQDGVQYLASIDSTVSYITTTTVMAKEQQNENEPPYCVAY
eukprot:Phypoly_transcript_19484.p1 GENE.Phypoly_transcript_19484~~Phypoly_transcript_19484.p1  ORF type:complete len:214 (+),score=50.04 Phypoly_transcript_19484:30-644(+)